MRIIGAIMGMLAVGAVSSPDPYKYLGYFNSPLAAFLNFGDFKGERALYITSFGFAPGAIDFIPSIASKLGDIPAIKPENIISDIVWPNEVIDIPDEMFGPNYILSCGGFLAPGSRTGEVLIINVANKTEFKISIDENQYFYHLGAFYDVDGDGLLDILSAKTNYPVFGAGDGKLVWFKNPGTLSTPWKETILFRGPDVFFRLYDFTGDGKPEIVASIFVNEKLSMFYNTGTFSNTADWKEVVIDSKMGAPFDVRVTDLNNDGKPDLLATNHQDQVDESAVFAFEVPEDITNQAGYVRHVIAMGFETTQPGEGQASPGGAQSFYPVVSRTDEKPLIAVSGDGSQTAYVLRPNSESPLDWTYTMESVIFVNNTVGGIAVEDIDKDGYNDLFIPNFNDGHVHIFTFKP